MAKKHQIKVSSAKGRDKAERKWRRQDKERLEQETKGTDWRKQQSQTNKKIRNKSRFEVWSSGPPFKKTIGDRIKDEISRR